jgi:CDP-4-dehydro-6-deoxyglucose reductase, E1
VDVDRATMAIDLDSAESALSGKTRGMFLIHALGRAADMDRYVAFCARHELTLLEDSCESLGAHSGGSHVGRFGPVASFSCYFSHHISTIEGGVVITDDDGLRDDLVSLRAHGWLRDRSDRQYWTDLHPDLDPRFLFVHAGYNVRPMELQAAIGRVQLARLDQMLTARETLARNVGAWVAASAPWLELIGSECLDVPPRTRRERRQRRERRHSWMTFPFRLRADAPASIEQVKAWLETRGVETRPIIAGNLTRHPALARFEHRVVPDLAASNELLQRGFMIGCHPTPAPGTLDTLEQALLSLADMPEKVRPRT